MIIRFLIKNIYYRMHDNSFNSKPDTSKWSDDTTVIGHGNCGIQFDVEANSMEEAQEKINKAFQKLINEK